MRKKHDFSRGERGKFYDKKKAQLSPAEKELRKLRAKICRKRQKIQHVGEEIQKCQNIIDRTGKRALELKLVSQKHHADKAELEKELGKKGV